MASVNDAHPVFSRHSVTLGGLGVVSSESSSGAYSDPLGRQVHVARVERPSDGGPSRQWLRIEGNPSRWAQPDGHGVLPLSAWDRCIGLVGAVAERLGEVDDRPGAVVRLTRVDLARDFRYVTAPGVFVHGLQGLPRPYASRVGVFGHPTYGHAQTLTAGNGTRLFRLYDQHAAYDLEPGSLRWEVELRTDALGRADARTVTPGDLHAAAEASWEWSRCGEPVSSVAGLAHALHEAASRGGSVDPVTGEWVKVSGRVATSVLGAVTAAAAGVPSVSRASLYRYRPVLRAVGVSGVVPDGPGDSSERMISERVALDWSSGREVVR